MNFNKMLAGAKNVELAVLLRDTDTTVRIAKGVARNLYREHQEELTVTYHVGEKLLYIQPGNGELEEE